MLVINLEDKSEHEIEVTRDGENAMPCPVCSKDRKKERIKCFSFNYAKKAGRCNHCGIVLVEKREYIEPIKYKRPVFKQEASYLSQNVISWFASRSISIKTLSLFKITEGKEWMPQVGAERNTIQFNYFRNGELINTKFRDGEKNFKLVSEAELIPYNLDAVINGKQVIWVEGEMDCLSVHESGLHNVISVPNGATVGKNNLTYLNNCIDLFSEDTEHILAFDNDLAGNALRDEFARRLGAEKCSKVTFLDCKDANECLVKYGRDAVKNAILSKQEFPVTGIFTAKDINDDIDDYFYNGLPEGSDIGLPYFDELLKFHPGYITTITGIPSHGKSEFLDFIMTSLNIRHKWSFGIYSPENYPLQLHFSKIAEKLLGKSFSVMNEAELGVAKKYFNDNFHFIKPEENNKLENILEKTKYLVRKKGIRAFIIDAWNKLEHDWQGSETQYISKELDKLATFCERNGVHLFLVAHPTKISKDKQTGLYEVPNLYSISGSANFFNKTHNGISVYRNFTTNRTEIYVQKVKFKHWGKHGMVELEWNPANGRYHKYTPDSHNWITGQNHQIELMDENAKVSVPAERKLIPLAEALSKNIPTGEEEAPF